MIKWIIEKFLGVEVNRNNFEKSGIIPTIIVIFVTYLFLGPADLFTIIENLIQLSKQPWYASILAQFSFVMVSVRIVFLSLFTHLNNPFGRFKVAFSAQMVGFLVGVILNLLLNDFIKPSPNIDSEIKFLYGLIPFAINIMIFVYLRRVYTEENFDEREHFRTDSNI